jgi:HD superfamily phosphodiesterase
VREIFNEKNVKCPHISYLDNSHYFYTYFNKVKHSIITGPDELYAAYEKISNEIIESRKDYNGKSCRFKNIEDAISKIHEKFDIIPELEGIYKLKTYNKIHHETVSKHTKSVVNNIKTKTFFKNFESSDKNILILSAYLHDIGKGPKTRWKNGIQEVDHNHPVKSLNMLKRILIDDLQYLTNEEIKLLCLNIVYHDIIGEIVGKNRDINQLKKIIKKEKELDMIIELGCADMAAIKLGFFLFNKGKIANIRNDVMSNLN